METLSSAVSRSVPVTNLSETWPKLSELELVISTSPSRLLSCSSCSSTISRSISSGLAPGQMVVTTTCGSSTVGVSCTGMRNSASVPNSTSRMAPTAVVTG